MSLRTTPDIDDRVYCWHCKRRAFTVSVPMPSPGGYSVIGTVQRRVCALGLAYNPFILRQCDEFIPVRPEHRQPFPEVYRA